MKVRFMNNKILLVVLLMAFIAIALIACFTSRQSEILPNRSPSASEEDVTSRVTTMITQQEKDIIKLVMDYIRTNHSETSSLINSDIVWTRIKMIIAPGNTQCIYKGNGWTLYVSHSATPESFYSIRAEYNDTTKIVWIGAIKNDVVTERSYSIE